ncbi:helix-turn-helix domain-containing protein [Mucilaginibacter lutimaris]|uniref:Helix-turn-helix domain-containing protein n=1 Tax=Mucilaginibacter lutimaris TaxID=931629 RepID=A0ABW2ZEH7_9SPHI
MIKVLYINALIWWHIIGKQRLTRLYTLFNITAMINLNVSSDIAYQRSGMTADHHFFNIQKLEDGAVHSINKRADTRYRIIFLKNGECEYVMDRRKLAIDNSKIGIVRPNNAFSLAGYEAAHGYMISFSHDFLQLSTGSSALLQSVFLNLGDIDQIPVPKSEHRFLKDVMERLIYEYNTSNGMKDEVVRGLFQVFAAFLSRATAHLQPVNQGKCLQQTKKFFSLLDQHFTTLKMPADYARLMAVTPAYLNNMVKETLGNTTSYFIQQRILAEAKRLMNYDEFNMKEVAYKLGFFDVSHFSKFFKRISGERFTDYKRNIAA